MSGDLESGAAFTELKENESTANLPGVSASATSSLASSANDKSSFPAVSTVNPTSTFPSNVGNQKHGQTSTKNAGGFTSVTTNAPRYSYEWFMFYLSQTRVMVVLLLAGFFLGLCIAAWSIGSDSATDGSSNGLCPQWGDIVPDVVSKCPANTLQIYFNHLAVGVERGRAFQPMNVTSTSGPLAVFLPGASSFYYYTLIMLDRDDPTPRNPTNRNHLMGLITNLRLHDSLDISQGRTLTWYEPPVPSQGSGRHRYVWLLYRHSSEFEGDGPTVRNKFIPEKWINSQSWGGALPELIAANYFTVQNN